MTLENENQNLLENMAEGPSCSTERAEKPPVEQAMSKKRCPPRLNRLNIHSSYSSLLPPSPLTPSSIFSFELTDSPGFHGPPSSVRKLRASRNRATPSSTFNFEFDLPPIEELDGETSRTPSRRPSKGRNSIMTIHRINQVIPVTNWRSVRLIAIILFIIRVQFTVYFASFQPMVKTMDDDMSHTFYALINGLYSLGVAMSAPIFGVLANKFGFRRPALLTFFIMFWSNVGFVFLGNIPSNRRYYAMVCRFFVGIAAGGSSILNTYWVTVTQGKDAATAAAYTDAAMCLGLAFGPLIQLASSQISMPGFVLFGFLHFNMYTVPAMIAMVLIIIATVLMCCCFQEEEKKPEIAESDSGETCSKEESEIEEEPPLDYFALFLCFFIRFMQSMFYANVETNNPSFLSWMFSFSKDTTSTVGSAICSASGFLGFGFLIVYVWTGTAKKVNNRIGVLTGFVICLIFLLGSFSYSGYSEFITHKDCIYSWCSSTHTISLPLFIVVYLLLFSFGFPLLNVHTSALLAKQLGGRKQAHWHGLSSFIGTASRVVAAPTMAAALQHMGIVFTWYLQIGLIAPMIVTIIVCYNRLGTPLRISFLPVFRRLVKKDSLEPEKNPVVE